MGERNSSITRVRPVFRQLFQKDRSGQKWLPVLLRLASRKLPYAEGLAANTGELLDDLFVKRKHPERELGKELELESCFEKSLPPPERFLEWLIRNPHLMKKPEGWWKGLSVGSKRRRRDLFEENGPEAFDRIQKEALDELERVGASKSKSKWWAFEGFTEVDCYLETERLIILIEGKRTDVLSPATQWYPKRNQLARNLEVAEAAAEGREFAVIVASEEQPGLDSRKALEDGLPHCGEAEREVFAGHYLGHILWKDLCRETGLDYASLPDKVKDAVDE